MNSLKKVITTMMAVLIALIVASPAQAAGNASITITNAVEGSSYHVYKVFDASFSSDGKSVSYTIDETSAFFSTVKESGYFTLTQVGDTSTYNVVANEGFNEAAAKDLAASLSKVSPKPTVVASGTATGSTLAFNGLDNGYYFVDTTTGTLCDLATANNVEIKDKNEVPTVDKFVQEDSIVESTEGAASGDGVTGYQKKNDADLGQAVYYKTVITAQEGAVGYVLHDSMTGLTFDGIDGVYVNSVSDDTKVAAGNYSVSSTSDGFDITFADSWTSTLADGDQIIVLYHATVNQDAVIAGDGNPNVTYLEYGNKNDSGKKPTTPEHETRTYVWEIDVLKYTGTRDNTLAGAVFQLKKGDQVLYFVETEAGYKLVPAGTEGAVSEIKTPADGSIKFIGLDADTYTLVETDAPEGYNKLTDTITVTITSTTDHDKNDKLNSEDQANKTATVSYKMTKGTDTSTGTVYVENKSGSELPSTGGMGTTMFYVAGAGLVAVAAAGFAVKRRRTQA